MLLVWPALLNGYPILFSDTGGLLEMGLELSMGWDKPWIYGPFLAASSLGLTLWLPLVVQGFATSWMLWLTQVVTGSRRPGVHAALCAMLSVGSAAPWFASLLMPDLFTPIVVLCLFVLAFGHARLSRGELSGVMALGTFATAAHLSHLILAAACLAVMLPVRWRLDGLRAWRPAIPLAGGLALLLLTNGVGNGVVGVSPYGSVFALARLVGDGPGRAYLDDACPDPGLRICAWQGRLSADSDEFLWHPYGPIWAESFGPIRYAPEAARLVPAIIAAFPIETLRAAAANTLRQLARTQVGDALVPDHLDVAVLPRIQLFFPAAEANRFRAALQSRGVLTGLATPFAALHSALLVVGAIAGVGIALRHWRTDRALATLAALALVALLANAFATGALSGPHDRYQARIAWLVLLAPALFVAQRYAARAETSAGLMRTRLS